MNTGIISTRYARALYSLAFDQGQEDKVYADVACLALQFLTYPELRKYITSPIMKTAQKIDLLQTASGGNTASSITKMFIDFVVKRDKQEFLQYICAAYQNVYRKAKNIVACKFTSASEVDSDTLGKVRALIEKTYNANVELEVKIDENLIGGFVLDVDNNKLDASVAGELQRMRIELLK